MPPPPNFPPQNPDVSFNSLGLRDMSFANMWSSVNEDQAAELWTQFGLDMFCLLLSEIVLGICLHFDPKGCGIPLREWLMCFFILYFSRSSLQVLKIYVVQYYS